MSASDGRESRLKIVLCWHMHQPQYYDPVARNYHLPWTYLHGIKDYVDMAAHIESSARAKAVVNFAPVLLEQIEDYAKQLTAHLANGASIGDPLLNALAQPQLVGSAADKKTLLTACLKANRKRLVERFPSYNRLVTLLESLDDDESAARYLNDQFLHDLIVWYHLAWMGETVRRTDPRIATLEAKAQDYSHADRRLLVSVISELLNGIIPRYRALSESGKVELSVSPYAHPIIPLLLDLQSARDAMPQAPLPTALRYPGGEERVNWQITHGLHVFEKSFGFKPAGCWPSEGAVSAATLNALEKFGFRWAATGQRVLTNSLQRFHGSISPEGVHRAYRMPNSGINCFFRDDGLSDLIGFNYADWHADDAVANLVHHLETIAKASSGQPHSIVSIILDGENAWEYFPNNGYYFLNALYERLGSHPKFELTTFGDALGSGLQACPLKGVVAGSWVYGTFSTWIGEEDKNRAWDMLVDAKQTYDAALARRNWSADELAALQVQLARCEGSDWFWWFGDFNPSEAVADFDQLFRLHLSKLYILLGETPPAYLDHGFSSGGGSPEAGGVMRRGS